MSEKTEFSAGQEKTLLTAKKYRHPLYYIYNDTLLTLLTHINPFTQFQLKQFLITMQFPSIFPTNIIFYIKSTHLNKILNSIKTPKLTKQ